MAERKIASPKKINLKFCLSQRIKAATGDTATLKTKILSRLVRSLFHAGRWKEIPPFLKESDDSSLQPISEACARLAAEWYCVLSPLNENFQP